MNTKDVLLVVGGVALGYFASKMNYGSRTATAVGEVVTGATDVATGVVTDVKDVAETVLQGGDIRPEGTGGIKPVKTTTIKAL
jgi:hypothetical protein